MPLVFFFVKNLLLVACVRSRRSSLAHVREGMLVIKGHRKRAKDVIHSFFI